MNMKKQDPRGLGSPTRGTHAPFVKAHQSTTDVETSPLDEAVLNPIDRGHRNLHAVCFEGSDDLAFGHARTDQFLNDGAKVFGHRHDGITSTQGFQYIYARKFVATARAAHHQRHGEETTQFQRAHRSCGQALSGAMAWRQAELGCAVQALQSEGAPALTSQPFAYIKRTARGRAGRNRGNSPRSRHTESIAAR